MARGFLSKTCHGPFPLVLNFKLVMWTLIYIECYFLVNMILDLGLLFSFVNASEWWKDTHVQRLIVFHKVPLRFITVSQFEISKWVMESSKVQLEMTTNEKHPLWFIWQIVYDHPLYCFPNPCYYVGRISIWQDFDSCKSI